MSRKRVLVVDDSALLRQVLNDAFSPHDYEVIEAADGREALLRLAEASPDLIIADILMPVMDGWALCEEVRRDPSTRDLPFIFLTTERDVPKRIKGLEMGADDYVCKPFSKEELLARAAGLLRRAGRGRRAAAAAPTPRQHLSGSTDHIGMADLLQLLSLNAKTGTLHLTGESVARVYFRHGAIVNAETQGLTGEKALFRIMAWRTAWFDFEPGEPARAVEAVLKAGTSTVLIEGFAHLDELRDLIEKLPPASARLRIPPGSEDAREGVKLTTTHRLILFTAGHRGVTLRQLIDTVPEKDLAAYAAVNDLLHRGLLEALPEEPEP